MDLAPTLLDLLGIRIPVPFAGHSLLDTTYRSRPIVFASHGREIALEDPTGRGLFSQLNWERQNGTEWFGSDDFAMDSPLPLPPSAEPLQELGRSIQTLTDFVWITDQILPNESEDGGTRGL